MGFLRFCRKHLKSWKYLVNKQKNIYPDIICWSSEGNSFTVKNIDELSDKVLPNYFKHNNFTSFVRQLNLYDFHKIRSEANENEFKHRFFKRG